MKHVYLSPHFDDVVYSSGGRIAKQVQDNDEVLVVTLFGGTPPTEILSSLAQRLHAEWQLGWHAVQQRANEDWQALSVLGAQGEHWSFVDAIYRQAASGDYCYTAYEDLFDQPHPADESVLDKMVARLLETLAPVKENITLYAPLGVGEHVDHILVRKAAWQLFEQGYPVLFYEEQPYASNSPTHLAQALFPQAACWWNPVLTPISIKPKLEALACYGSQDKSGQVGKKIADYATHTVGNGKPAERLWQPVKRQSVSTQAWREIIVCPKCAGKLRPGETQWQCVACEGVYPLRFGILDLRTFSPEQVGYLSLDADLEKAQKLWEMYAGSSYEDLANYYVQSVTSSELADHYLAYRMAIKRRVLEILTRQINFSSEVRPNWLTGAGLDIGCGSGVGVLALTTLSPLAIGVDITLSDLICARKLLEEQGLSQSTLLVAGCAEALPLRNNYFATVVSRDVYEHVTDRASFLQEAYRVLKVAGVFLFNTTSRFTWVEPHVRLRGLGYLPRFLQPSVVRLLRQRGYDIFLPALWELKQDIRRALPPNTPFTVKAAVRIQADQTPATRKGRLIRQLPALVRLINGLYAQMRWFEAVVSKQAPATPAEKSALHERFLPSSARRELRHLWYHSGWLVQTMRNRNYKSALQIAWVIGLRIIEDMRLLLWGNSKKVRCELCGWQGHRFYPLTDRGISFFVAELCPNCNSRSRHRACWHYLQTEIDRLKSRNFTVLEIGPTGGLDRPFKAIPEAAYTGVDLQKLPQTDACADATKLPFQDDSFDLVICFNVICGISDDIGAVAEMGRVCRAGGKVILSDAVDEQLARTIEFDNPQVDKHRAFHWYGRDFAKRFSQPELNFVENRFTFDLPSDIVQRYGLSRRILFVAEKQVGELTCM